MKTRTLLKRFPWMVGAALAAGSTLLHAQTTIDVKVLGVTFIEAPPGKDKNLVPFAATGDMEKVEINAIATAR